MTLELILYLEPSKTSALFTQVQDYFNLCQNLPWAENEALKYPVHITMVGFFDDPTSSTNTSTASTTVTQARLIEFISRWITNFNVTASMSVSATTVIQGLIRPSQDSLLIGIEPSPALLDLTHSLKESFLELGLRLKRINHISLCYWDEQATILGEGSEEQEQVQEISRQRVQWVDEANLLAQEQIPLLGSSSNNRINGEGIYNAEILSAPCLNDSWDIVLYSIHSRDKRSQIPYPLIELKRWTLS